MPCHLTIFIVVLGAAAAKIPIRYVLLILTWHQTIYELILRLCWHPTTSNRERRSSINIQHKLKCIFAHIFHLFSHAIFLCVTNSIWEHEFMLTLGYIDSNRVQMYRNLDTFNVAHISSERIRKWYWRRCGNGVCAWWTQAWWYTVNEHNVECFYRHQCDRSWIFLDTDWSYLKRKINVTSIAWEYIQIEKKNVNCGMVAMIEFLPWNVQFTVQSVEKKFNNSSRKYLFFIDLIFKPIAFLLSTVFLITHSVQMSAPAIWKFPKQKKNIEKISGRKNLSLMNNSSRGKNFFFQ